MVTLPFRRPAREPGCRIDFVDQHIAAVAGFNNAFAGGAIARNDDHSVRSFKSKSERALPRTMFDRAGWDPHILLPIDHARFDFMNVDDIAARLARLQTAQTYVDVFRVGFQD